MSSSRKPSPIRAQGLFEVFFKKKSSPSQNRTQDFLKEKFTKKNSGSECNIRSMQKIFFENSKFFSEKNLKSCLKRGLDLFFEKRFSSSPILTYSPRRAFSLFSEKTSRCPRRISQYFFRIRPLVSRRGLGLLRSYRIPLEELIPSSLRKVQGFLGE